MEAMASVLVLSRPVLPSLASLKFPSLTSHARHRCRLSPCRRCRNVDLTAARRALACRVSDRGPTSTGPDGDGFISNKVLQLVLWSMTGFYVVWLFILPFAPGDPAWAINKETLEMLLDLSLNFFILPLTNVAGFHLVESPVVHPTVEALFNLVMGWTLLFGPVLFSDCKRNRFKGSLEALWLGQWLLTNTFLIPYMAVRLNPAPDASPVPSKFASTMQSETTTGNRWEYFVEYVKTDRVGYAFVWDLCLYSIFQPWLIQSNLHNIKSLWGLSDVEVPDKAPSDDETS